MTLPLVDCAESARPLKPLFVLRVARQLQQKIELDDQR